MVNRVDSNKQRLKRHKRVRAKISGTAQKPRMCVYRSLNNIYVQIIDDTAGKTSVEPAVGNEGGNKESAKKVGALAAQRAIEKGITEVVFDRGGYIYHGRIIALADGAREAGLKF